MKIIIYFFLSFLLISCQPKTVETHGGLIVDIEITDDASNESKINSALDIFKKRIENIFENNPQVILSTDKKSIQLKFPLVTDSTLVKDFVVRKGQFKTIETYNVKEIYGYLDEINSKLAEDHNYQYQIPVDISKDSGKNELQKNLSEIEKETIIKNKFSLFTILNPNISSDGSLADGPAIGISMLKDTALVDSIFRDKKFSSLLPNDFECKWSRYSQNKFVWLIALKKPGNKNVITSEMIADAKTVKGEFTDNLEVNFILKPEYVHLWTEMTRNNINRSLAILIDDDVFSYPKVVSEIVGGNSSITGQFIEVEAKALAMILKYGPIPVDFKIKGITKL